MNTEMSAEQLAAFLDWSEQHLNAARPDMHPAQADKIAAVITTLRRVQAELAADKEADA